MGLAGDLPLQAEVDEFTYKLFLVTEAAYVLFELQILLWMKSD